MQCRTNIHHTIHMAIAQYESNVQRAFKTIRVWWMQRWQLAVVPNGQWYIGSIVGHRWLDTRQMFRLDPLFHRFPTHDNLNVLKCHPFTWFIVCKRVFGNEYILNTIMHTGNILLTRKNIHMNNIFCLSITSCNLHNHKIFVSK